MRKAAQALKSCNVGICAPVGFPKGAASMAAKLFEIKECVANVATELDVELNIVAIKSGEFEEVKRELKAMVDAAGNAGAEVKQQGIRFLAQNSIYNSCQIDRSREPLIRADSFYVLVKKQNETDSI
jgi:deoxyribose-phosphate aldolase